MAKHGITPAKILRGVRASRSWDASEADQPIGEWLEQHYIHPRGNGPTRHRTALTPYWGHWLDIAQARIQGRELDHDPYAHRTEQIWLTTGNQLGKTLAFLMALWAWVMAVSPRACGIVYPQLSAIKKAQKSRAKPILELSDRLRDLVPGTAAERDRRLGLTMWELRSAITHWINGGTSGDTRTQDLPLVLLDEYDLLAHDLDGQGSAIKQLLDRQKTYPHSKLAIGVTTPTWVSGHGWQRLHGGSHERLMIACPACGAHDYLRDEQLWHPDDATPDEIAVDDLGRYVCRHCDHHATTAEIRLAVAQACETPGWSAAGGYCGGAWEPDDHGIGGGIWTPIADTDTRTGTLLPAPIRTAIRSGHLSSLYSPFLTLGDYVADQIRADRTSEEERVAHLNGWAGLPAAPRRDSLDQRDLIDSPAVGDYPYRECPIVPAMLVAFFDQQGNTPDRAWFPYVVRAYDKAGNSWKIEADKASSWTDLEAILKRRWICGGQPRGIDICGMDAANGNMIRTVRSWCARDPRRRISLALSGTLAPDHPYSWEQLGPKNAGKLCGLPVVYTANAHLFRDELLETIRGTEGRPAWHIPSDAPAYYMASLQSEERIPGKRLVRGRMTECLIWQPRVTTLPDGRQVQRSDNHWWDCEVCLIALMTILRLTTHQARTQDPHATARAMVQRRKRDAIIP